MPMNKGIGAFFSLHKTYMNLHETYMNLRQNYI